MGKCWALLRPSEGSCLRGVESESKQNVVRVVKMDGKMLAPLLVKDVLGKCSGWGIGSSKTESNSPSFVADTQRAGGVRRIKVVITKQEFQQLLTKQISAAEVLAGLEKRNVSSSPRNWKPKLESILEVNE
ncbi:uncharacterized protein LOC120204675 [Hibiscus syriacus]|uniref:uncharacterized protein LOC120204675 n=1 Tax=Hibiscus syriacus TaxID=106335 RepID=UPI0019231C39|nr:uncharacterized protein LOC120204675 [Hibiscus syriacus]